MKLDDLAGRLESTSPPSGRLVWQKGDEACYIDFDTLVLVRPGGEYRCQVVGVDLDALT